jgi:hypothetical protein
MFLVLALVGCMAVVDGGPAQGKAGAGRAGGAASSASATGGEGGNGVSTGTTSGSGGAGDAIDAGGSDDGSRGAADASSHDGGPGDGAAKDAGALDGGATLDGGDIGPIVAPDCPGDPTSGWTEYADTFRVEHPYDLMVSDRYTFVSGIHTFWVFPNDLPHAPGNTTAPRTEAHWTNFTTGQKMWTGDMLVESPSTPTTVFQVHTTATGAGPVYIRVANGTLSEINGSVLARNVYDKWINLKVAFDAATSTGTIYVNNCQKLVLPHSRPGSGDFYFKNGVYTCTSSICRDHYKNIRLYQR